MYEIIVGFGKGRVGNNVAANRVLPFPKLMPLESTANKEKERQVLSCLYVSPILPCDYNQLSKK